MSSIPESWLIGLFVFVGIMYLGLNIMGTIYYSRLRKRGDNTPALVALVLGWMGPSILSLYPVSLEMKANA